MLNEIIGIIGFILLVLGSGGMESESLLAPAAMAITGMGVCIWSAWESGIFDE